MASGPSALDERHRDEVVEAYKSADRLRLYSILAGLFGIVLVLAVIGAMIIGWLDYSDGFSWLGLAVLLALVPSAKFYSEATRTTVNAAGLERGLGLDEDLFKATEIHRRRVRTFAIVGFVAALIAAATITGYAIANAGTEKPDDDDDKGEQDDREDDAPSGNQQQQQSGDDKDDDDKDDD